MVELLQYLDAVHFEDLTEVFDVVVGPKNTLALSKLTVPLELSRHVRLQLANRRHERIGVVSDDARTMPNAGTDLAYLPHLVQAEETEA